MELFHSCWKPEQPGVACYSDYFWASPVPEPAARSPTVLRSERQQPRMNCLSSVGAGARGCPQAQCE